MVVLARHGRAGIGRFHAIFTPPPRPTIRAWDKVILSKVVDQHMHNIMLCLVLQVDQAISRGGPWKKLCRPCWRRTERTLWHGPPTVRPRPTKPTTTHAACHAHEHYFECAKTKPSLQNPCLHKQLACGWEWNSLHAVIGSNPRPSSKKIRFEAVATPRNIGTISITSSMRRFPRRPDLDTSQ